MAVGAQFYVPHLLEIVARRPVYVRLALWFLHHPAWMEPHGWVLVDTHSAPVPSTTGEAVGDLCIVRAQSTTGRGATAQGQMTKSQEQKSGRSRGTERGRDSSFCNADGHTPLKNSELDQKFQKYTGRVALRGDTVKDDSGSHDVFSEQGSSASQLTAAKVVDVMARPGQHRTSIRRSVRSSQNGGRSSIAQTSRGQSVQTSGHVNHDTSG